MAEFKRGDGTLHTNSDLPAVGSKAPAFTLTKQDMSELSSADLAGKRVVLNIFPSLETAVCAASVRTFNQRAAEAENTVVVCVSADLPFAAKRFCEAEGIANVVTASTFRHPEFSEAFGTRIVDGPVAGLNARSVVVLDTDGTVVYNELVPVMGQEPNYDGALGALA